MGEPSRALMAAKLPAEAITRAAVGGASFLARCTARAPSPLLMAISGASGPRTTPRVEGGQCGEEHPLERAGGGCPSRLEALGRLVAGGARQVGDGRADQHAGDGQ